MLVLTTGVTVTTSMHQPVYGPCISCSQLPESSKWPQGKYDHTHVMDKDIGLWRLVRPSDDSRASEGRDWDSLILMFQPRGDPYFPHLMSLKKFIIF